MKEVKGRKSPFWTDAETERLVDMADQGLSNVEIAVALQRSVNSVAGRLQRIGWHGSTRRCRTSKDVREKARGFVQDSPRRTLDCMPNPFRRGRDKNSHW